MPDKFKSHCYRRIDEIIQIEIAAIDGQWAIELRFGLNDNIEGGKSNTSLNHLFNFKNSFILDFTFPEPCAVVIE